MEIKTTFDPRYGEKAHQDTILAGPVRSCVVGKPLLL